MLGAQVLRLQLKVFVENESWLTYADAAAEELVVVVVWRSFESETPEGVSRRWFNHSAVRVA